MLTLSIILSLHSRSIDFTTAYTQADLDVDKYLEMSPGFVTPDDGNYILKLDKNLYGLKQADKDLFDTQHLALEQHGFT